VKTYKVRGHEIEIVPQLDDSEIEVSEVGRKWRVSVPKREFIAKKFNDDALMLKLMAHARSIVVSTPKESEKSLVRRELWVLDPPIWNREYGWEWLFLLYLREEKLKLMSLFRCEKCGSLMAGMKELKDAPVTEEIVIAHDKRRCIGCALEG